ncbi:MAG: uracil-DNA glycosylase [Desulfosarcina sp.]|nr:uracil-DNA glycosylase [Desulfosarcina sp.]MBC2742765.1 uracil-DNA glycosylase [Desulfosarcina sp.]MBC2765675.1 uracil-DNA glycosylase [Desulfosarcina sp.]
MNAEASLAQIIRDIQNTLCYLKQSGCTGFNCSEESLKTLSQLRLPSLDAAVGRETLADIRTDLGDCTRCGLCKSRTHIVFGEGSPSAQLVFVGEGPGFDEDQSGQPFVGAAGQLLTKIIAAMNLSRERVYICNIVKCRPPGNRNPASDEIRQCLPFLKRQLAAINPRVICALGRVAAQTLLETETPISRLRGRFHEVMGIPVMPTFHPAFLLRSPDKKRDVWDDVQQIMKMLE